MAAPNILPYTPPPTVRDFIKDFIPGRLFYDWIVGPYGPVSADTEFLTPSGWKRIDAYTPGDLIAQWEPASDNDPAGGALRFVAPQDYIVTPAETLLHFSNKHSMSMVLSPCHRLVYYDHLGRLQERPAGVAAQMRGKRTIPTAFCPTERPGTGWSDAVLRLAVAINADGYFPATSPGSTARADRCHIVVRRDRKKQRLRELLRAAGVEWQEHVWEGRPTETSFSFVSPYVGKTFAGKWWDATTLELEAVLDEALYWDGWTGGKGGKERRFGTTSKPCADFIQYAAHATGGRATIGTYTDPRNADWRPFYYVQIASKTSYKRAVNLSKATQIVTVPAEGGKQYCFRTASSYFVARHNGRIFVTGNSGKTTGLFFKLAYLAALQAPGRDGIRRSRAVVVRNTAPMLRDTTLVSWNYWFRDGEAGKWLATDKTFVLRYGDVECEVLFRPLDTPDDVRRVLSLEVTFALLDEFVEIPREIVQALSGRVGRYPAKKDGGATNYGMWGASNPGTEDVWWYDMLHTQLPGNAKYFHQPSGTSPNAENLENLPANYYKDLAEGKTPDWIKQFIDAEWGYSISGKPVVPSFKPDLHIAKARLLYNPQLPLVFGFDPGFAGMAAIFGQQDLHGRLLVLGEVIAQNISAERFITEKLRPYHKALFPDANIICEPDPAAANRAQTDAKSVVDIIKRYYPAKPETNNRLPLRLDAIDYFTGKLTDMGPALQIDAKQCPTLIRALKGGWRWEVDQKRGSVIKGEVPEKNPYSHPGDAFGYLCRHYQRGAEKDYRYSQANGGKGFRPQQPTFGVGSYHYR